MTTQKECSHPILEWGIKDGATLKVCTKCKKVIVLVSEGR